MVACSTIASAFCVFASLVDGRDSIPPSAGYELLPGHGTACRGAHIFDGLVESWGKCQMMCEDSEQYPGCKQFTVYSRTTECAPPGHKSSMPVCTRCQLDTACEHSDTVSDAATFKRLEAGWPAKIAPPGGEIMRQINIYRCMYDVPPLRWSDALKDQAFAWAQQQGEQLKKQHPLPSIPGFDSDQLEQNVHVATSHSGLASTAKNWFDFTLAVDEWYGVEAAGTLGPMLSKSTTYIGCGGHYGGNPDNGYQTLVCDYGSETGTSSGNSNGCWNTHAQDSQGTWGWCEICDGGNLQQCCTADKATGCDGGKNCKCSAYNIPDAGSTAAPPKRNKKTPEQCALDVDSTDQIRQYLNNKLVTISYTPTLPVHLSASEQSDSCNIKEYRLVNAGELKLVAIDANTNKPCEGTGVTELHGWSHSFDGMYDKSAGAKDCLMVNPTAFTLTTDSGENTCTRNNLWFENPSGQATGGWHFSQQSLFPPEGHQDWCMPQVDEADKPNPELVIDSSQLSIVAAGDGGEGCSAKWTVSWFEDTDTLNNMEVVKEPTLQSGPRATCSKCLRDYGNFACALPDDKCSLAPTEVDCNAHGGEWCGPVDWKIQGSCGHPLHRCDGAVDPLQTPGPADCHQLGGVYKTDFNDCALIADGVYTEDDCRESLMKQNSYEDQDVKDCVNLVKQTQDKPANVFDTVHGYIYDNPEHPKYCRLWYCSKLSDEAIPKQDGDQAWLIAYKTKNTKNSLSIMV